MSEAAYEVDDLVLYYQRRKEPATDHVSFDVRRGEVFGILGDNGAGKTTLIRQMVNLLRPTSGRIHLFGTPIGDSPMWVSGTVSYMPQSSQALNRLTVGEALFLTAHLRGLSRADARRERADMVDMWNLGPIRDVHSARLSGGQRRLFQLAVAMTGRLPVVVLDEPTNDLDPANRRMVWETLRKLNSEHGTTIVFITHDAIEAERIVNRVAIMKNGRFTALGHPPELKRDLADSMRLEVWYPAGHVMMFPAELPQHWKSDDNVVLTIPRDRVTEILARISVHESVDYRLYSATLEDLYLHHVSQT